MSLRTVGYVDGRPVKVDDGPAYARLQGIRGSLVQGEPGWREKVRKSRRAARMADPLPPGRPLLSPDIELIGRGKRPGYATHEERLAARRKAWRESKARKRAATEVAA